MGTLGQEAVPNVIGYIPQRCAEVCQVKEPIHAINFIYTWFLSSLL